MNTTNNLSQKINEQIQKLNNLAGKRENSKSVSY